MLRIYRLLTVPMEILIRLCLRMLLLNNWSRLRSTNFTCVILCLLVNNVFLFFKNARRPIIFFEDIFYLDIIFFVIWFILIVFMELISHRISFRNLQMISSRYLLRNFFCWRIFIQSWISCRWNDKRDFNTILIMLQIFFWAFIFVLLKRILSLILDILLLWMIFHWVSLRVLLLQIMLLRMSLILWTIVVAMCFFFFSVQVLLNCYFWFF